MIERGAIGLFLIGVASAIAVGMLVKALRACEEEMYEEGNWEPSQTSRRKRKEEAC